MWLISSIFPTSVNLVFYLIPENPIRISIRELVRTASSIMYVIFFRDYPTKMIINTTKMDIKAATLAEITVLSAFSLSPGPLFFIFFLLTRCYRPGMPCCGFAIIGGAIWPSWSAGNQTKPGKTLFAYCSLCLA